ncbi:MAG: 3'-5' exonuclease, partial [Betaproteobacteria bacterium]|nr:3'-5' exonuclease [Betaproteobacteria bacterium]
MDDIVMEWLLVLLIAIGIFAYFRYGKPRVDLSVLPHQFVVVDLETTGLDSSRHEIIEIGAVRVNRDSDHHTTFQAFIKPSRKIPAKITKITGITQEMIERDGEPLEPVLRQFLEFAGNRRLVFYNAEFDMAFLSRAAARTGLKIENEVSCALDMARRAWPRRRSYKLTDLAKSGGLSTDGAHRALHDCRLTITVYS